MILVGGGLTSNAGVPSGKPTHAPRWQVIFLFIGVPSFQPIGVGPTFPV